MGVEQEVRVDVRLGRGCRNGVTGVERIQTVVESDRGSSLSLTLFNAYMIPLTNIICSHNINILSYTDNLQPILSLMVKASRIWNKFMACMIKILELDDVQLSEAEHQHN